MQIKGDYCLIISLFVVVVQSLSHVQLFATPWTEARQASLSFTICQSLLKLMSIELAMPSLYYMWKKKKKACIVLKLGSILESLGNLKTSRRLISTPSDADVIDE